MNLPGQLIRMRNDRNFSQERVAEIAGVSRQAVAKWEAGRAVPDLDKLVTLARTYGVTLDALVNDDAACPRGTPTPLSGAEGPLVAFLLRAKKATYAGHGAETIPCRRHSHDLTYSENDFLYYDTYLGGEVFAGEEAVWQGERPVWAMNYAGRVVAEGFSGDFLKECLSLIPGEAPFRGPSLHRVGEFTYHCTVVGGFPWFSGTEEIFFGATKVYECLFHGGRIV